MQPIFSVSHRTSADRSAQRDHHPSGLSAPRWKTIAQSVTMWSVSILLGTLMLSVGIAIAQEREPAIGFESLLNLKMFDSGLVNFTGHDLVFAPPSAAGITSAIKVKGGATVLAYEYFPEYRANVDVFARLNPKGIPQHKFGPGDYVFEFSKDGAVFTRFPFSIVAKVAGTDPFSAAKSYALRGPWQRFAYFYFRNARDFSANSDVSAAYLNFWAGTSDAPPGKQRVAIQLRLFRDGNLVAHSRETQGMIQNYPMERHDIPLFHPHERSKMANARIFSRADLVQAGKYQLTVELQEGKTVIRDYRFESDGEKVVPHERTVIGYNPHSDYIVPRVPKQGSTTYAFEEAIWIESGK